MRTRKLLGTALGLLLSSAAMAASVPSADMDKITLSFLNAKVYAGGAVSCRDKEIGDRLYVGCLNRSLGGNSQVSLWLYEGGVFKSLNGTARGFAEGKLAGQPHIKTMPLPLPKDIDFGAAMSAFK
ncbi:hypothetical protein [Comamonas terrigena]|nr:hypothetical protein [Comamonas terrigena]BBL25358.1 hypothetical protein CT3_28130 [Comamonas terrigena NBRC 13299]SUY71064.1 Uncharacterised protein [Comamonas terrigena]